MNTTAIIVIIVVLTIGWTIAIALCKSSSFYRNDDEQEKWIEDYLKKNAKKLSKSLKKSKRK